MSTLEQQALDEMKVGVEAVLKGERDEFKTTLVPPAKVVAFVESLGGSNLDEFDSNGWQWDYWIFVEYEDCRFSLSGSGYYGGVTIRKAGEP